MIAPTLRRGGMVLVPETYYTTADAADRKVEDLREDGHVAERRSYLIGAKELYVVYLTTGRPR